MLLRTFGSIDGIRQASVEEVAALYAQHQRDTGQTFEDSAVQRAFDWTEGQPWLVNALARQLTQVLVKDRAQAITAAHVDEAKEFLIRRQDTHLDSLMDRLEEPRVRAILHERGDMLTDLQVDRGEFGHRVWLERAVGGGERRDPGERDDAVAGGARHPRVDLCEHRTR